MPPSLARPGLPFIGTRDIGNADDHRVASWYGPGFHGRTTANGERYGGLTAAQKSLPFETEVKVTNSTNGKAVIVRINDRGPYVGSRIIDLLKSAAEASDKVGPGTAAVTVQVLT